MCEDCKYRDDHHENVHCCTCIQWTDGYLDFTNYVYMHYELVEE